MLHNPAEPHDPPHPPTRSATLPPARSGSAQARDVAIDEPDGPARRTWREWFFRSERIRSLLSFQVSLLVHCLALIILGLFARTVAQPTPLISLVVAPDRGAEEPLAMMRTTLDDTSLEDLSESLLQETPQTEIPSEVEVRAPTSHPLPSGATSRAADAQQQMPISDLLIVSTANSGGGLQGRKPKERARLVAERGGTAASERAVELGLRWLAAHQRQDGSWWLNHGEAHACECRNPGLTETTVGATSLALLPYLGAGYTHREGPYQEVVQDGLDYLLSRLKQTQLGGDLREGAGHEMYSHGLATIVLCEAFAMTDDGRLLEPAQSAIDFICNAQHTQGGWRYKPGQPGDTTVTGWQVMALKSARMAQLRVPAVVVDKAEGFLNRVQDGRGAFYGYLGPDKEPGPTSVGLLLRMYLGWGHDDERLQRGVAYLARRGPSTNDMYYNYYATQVMHHFGGNYWPRWNKELREYLIGTQASKGHEAGSWFFPDPHGSVAGRHYTTAMCIMMLEVYYRHLPLYGKTAVAFEL